MKILLVYPGFQRHAEAHPELKKWVPMNEYFGSPSLGLSMVAAVTPPHVEVEYRDDRMSPATTPTDADLIALSFFTPAATRAFAIADFFRAQGKTVVAGGIFPTSMPDECLKHFDAVVRGEGELVWPKLLADFERGELKRTYEEPVGSLDAVPLPKLSVYFGAERDGFRPDDYPVQLTRGCPLKCQACVLPLSMGRSAIREFSVAHTIGQLRQLTQQGKRACLTEDTSWFPGQTSTHLMALFRAMIAEGLEASISYIGISMPQLLVTSEELLRVAYQAGVRMFYLVGGFDPITTRAFTGNDEKALGRAHRAIARAHSVGIEPYTSFLLGNDDDDTDTPDRMLAFAASSGIAKAEFAIFTPYPGTPSWERLNREERITTREWHLYNDANAVFRPAKMSSTELEAGYLYLWRQFYSDKHHYSGWEQASRTIQF